MCQVFHDKVKCAHTMSFLCIPTAISEVQVTNIPCLGYYNSLVAQNDTVSPNNKNSQYILSVHYVQSTLTTALYHYLIKPPNNLKVLIISLFYRWRKKTQKGQVTEWYHRARKWHTQNSSPSRQTSITNSISLLKFINVPQRTELNSFHSLTTLSTILSWPPCPAPSLLSTSFSMLQAHWSSVPGSLIL